MRVEELRDLGLEPLAALKHAVEFDDYLGDHAPHHGLDAHDDGLRVERFGYSCGKGPGEARGALPDCAGDAAAAGLGQRFGYGMAGEEVPYARMMQPEAQNALQGRGNTRRCVTKPVGELCGVGRKVGVVAGVAAGGEAAAGVE